VAVAAAYGGIQLMKWYAGVALSPGSTGSHLAAMDLTGSLNVLFLGMLSAGAVVALVRWWVPGVIVAVVGLLGYAVQWTVAPGLYGDGPFEPIAAALTALVVLACPPDRRGDRRSAVVAGAMAAIAWFPVALVQTRSFIVSTDYGAWPLLTLACTGVVLALRARSSGLRQLGAIAAASPLFLAHAATNGWLSG
jgi:hypothetical protein